MSTDLPLEVNRALKRPSSRGKMAEKGLFTAFGGSGPVRGTNNVVHSICSRDFRCWAFSRHSREKLYFIVHRVAVLYIQSTPYGVV